MQVQPLVAFPGQVGVLTVTINDGAAQLHFSGMVSAGPVIVMVALAGHSISGMVAVAVVDWPGGREPFGGLMLMPLTPLLDEFQGQLTWLFPLAAIVMGQLQPEPAV